jgi:hypothetical protein
MSPYRSLVKKIIERYKGKERGEGLGIRDAG